MPAGEEGCDHDADEDDLWRRSISLLNLFFWAINENHNLQFKVPPSLSAYTIYDVYTKAVTLLLITVKRSDSGETMAKLI